MSLTRLCRTHVLLGLGLASLAAFASARDFDVTAFGAVGDGRTLNTAAIQSALDTASTAGGGRVVLPAGVFLSGSIFLKPGTELHLAEGGVLLGSPDIQHYPRRLTRIEGQLTPWRLALVNSAHLDHVRLSGPGRIDGNGAVFWTAFWQRRAENSHCTNLEVERPRLVFIDDCRGVRISGLSLRDSGFWNIHLYRCRGVVIDGVSIYAPGLGAPLRAPSSDGIDIDSCQNVTVRRCQIEVDDDCIALKGTKGPFAARDTASPPVENILIEQCRFLAGGGVTCGSEATVVRGVTIRDCDYVGHLNVLRLKLRPDTPQRYEDILVEDIRLNGSGRIFEINPWTQFFDLKGQPPPARSVARVTLRRLSGTYGSMGRIAGNPGDDLSEFTLQDSQLTLADPTFNAPTVRQLVINNFAVNGVLLHR